MEQGFIQALQLIFSLNPEVVEITARSLYISLASVILASLVDVPLGGLIELRQFRGKRSLINLIQTLYSLPTVTVGLLVFLLISRSGPLGSLNLLFTPGGNDHRPDNSHHSHHDRPHHFCPAGGQLPDQGDGEVPGSDGATDIVTVIKEAR